MAEWITPRERIKRLAIAVCQQWQDDGKPLGTKESAKLWSKLVRQHERLSQARHKAHVVELVTGELRKL